MAILLAASGCSDDDASDMMEPSSGEDSGVAGRGGSSGEAGEGGSGGGKAGRGAAGRGGSGGRGGEAGDGGGAGDGGAGDGGVADSGSGGPGDNGASCEGAEDCDSGHCVSGVCCASACDSPDTCQLAEGATCEDGETCVYPAVEDDTPCDDGNVCTENDVCEDGECRGDGTDITTEGCLPDDACNQGWHCLGNVRGDCVPTNSVDCSHLDGECVAGMCDPEDGSCSAVPANEDMTCEDGDACTTGETCEEGVCGGGGPLVCDDENACTDDSCDSTMGCQFVNNTAACDDGDPCTEGDQCAVGICGGTPKDCSEVADQCNAGMCDSSDGSCVPMPLAASVSCNDDDSCTAGDHCMDGECAPGGGNACGENAESCTPGTPNICMCEDGYVDAGGTCVPNTNECSSGNACGTPLCDANATCHDPSSTCGDRECTCNDGYVGDGLECEPCPAGQIEVNGQCVCDLSGVFALRIAAEITWDPVTDGSTVLVEGGEATTHIWAIRNHEYGPDGQLHVTTIPCDGTAPDLCGTGDGLLPAETYAQYTARHIWGNSNDPGTIPVESHTMNLPNARAGQPFVSPETAIISGIHLDDPRGPWPVSREDVGTQQNPGDNGSYFVDHDQDGALGVTSHVVPPGGIDSDAPPPAPPIDFPEISETCGSRYAYVPGGPYGECLICRLTEIHSASRTTLTYDGIIRSCDLIDGDITGPDGGKMRTEMRVAGCRRVSGPGRADCGSAIVDDLDAEPTTQTLGETTFVIRRVPSNLLAGGVTCDEVRFEMTFD